MISIHWNFYPKVAALKPALDWIELLVKLQKAPKTIDAYARCLNDLIGFFERTGLPLVEAQTTDIVSYLADLNDQEGGAAPLANATLQQRLTVARLWYDHLIRCRLREDQRNPVGRGVYTPGNAFQATRQRGLLPHYQKQPWIPGDDEWDRFLNVVAKEESIRNQTMVLLAYDGALRRSELVALRVSDIDWPYNLVTIRAEIAKNHSARVIFFSEVTQQALITYVQYRRHLMSVYGGQAAGPLFISESRRNPGEPLTSEMWNKIVRGIAERANLPQFTTHTFRHLRLTHFARCKLEIYEIALLAGHKNLETTRLYINLSGAELGERVKTATRELTLAMQRSLQKVEASQS